MCKILLIPGLNPKNVENNWAFIESMAYAMSHANKDGLGYVSLTGPESICIERWHNNDDAFDVRVDKPNTAEKYLGFLKGSQVSRRYVKVGNYSDKIHAIMLHTRMATSGKEFENTHPFFDKETGTTLIHNGVIRNVETADNIRSTCDSERILNKYLEHGVASNLSNIQSMVDDLKGNFACGVLAKTADTVFIDIFKSRANLYAAKIKELGCMVFSTSLNDIEEVCKNLGFKILDKFECRDDMLLRLNAMTGEAIDCKEYKDTATPSYQQHSTYNDYWDKNKHVPKVSEADVNKGKVQDLVTNKDLELSKKIVKENIHKELNYIDAAVNDWYYDADSMTWFHQPVRQ